MRKEFADFLAEVDGEVAEAAEEAVEESSDQAAEAAKPKRTASNWLGFKGEEQPPEAAG